jgi:hypothetical protein
MTKTQFIIGFVCAFLGLVALNAFMFCHLAKAKWKPEDRK